MSADLKIAIAGLGTVGAGVAKLLAANADLIAQRCGRRITVSAVSARDRSRDRGIDLSGCAWFDDPVRMAQEADADTVVEVIGGEAPARAVIEAAIERGRHVVTANKALLAVHGTALARKAEAARVMLGYEAAVAGGIPVIKAVREGLAANRVLRVYGILNGTCNYILSDMTRTGRPFAEALADAQRLGYAETDPSVDVDGIDAAHKLAILSALAFGAEVDFASIHIEGIRDVGALDVNFARELGYRIKLLGLARITEHGLEQRLHPCMIPESALIARVDGVFNAVVVDGDFVGNTIFEGRGAGAGPTASAIVADLMDLARGRRGVVFAVPAAQLAKLPPSPMQRHVGAYYVRLMVTDRPGVIADVSAILRDEGISLESMLQRGREPDEMVPVVLTTHPTEEAAMRKALAKIGRLSSMHEPPRMIRIEKL